MDALNIIGGIVLATIGVWLTVVRVKKLLEGEPDTLGGGIKLLLVGIGCVAGGIILILKHI